MEGENQPSKKRAAGRELSRDNPGLDDEEDAPEQELGTFKKASDDVLARRKIVKVRRQPSSTPSAPSSNPFAGISLVPPPAPAAPPVNATTNAQPAKAKTSGEASDSKNDTNTEEEVTSKESEEKQGEGTVESNVDKENAAPSEQDISAGQSDQENNGGPISTAEREAASKPIVEKTAETDEKQEENGKEEHENPDAGAGSGGSGLSSFQQLSNSQNAFTGLSGTGFSSSSFSFGPVQKDGSPSQFSFGTSNNGNGSTSLFGSTGASIGVKSEGTAFPSIQEVSRETGEENDETVFSAESALFEYLDGGWKERGKGEVKLNVLKTDSQKARLVMRAKGNLRLMLNASIFPDMKLTKMDKKGVTFACVNTATEGKEGLSTFALKFKDVSVVEEFLTQVSAHKDKPTTTTTTTALKTPENSPKASDE